MKGSLLHEAFVSTIDIRPHHCARPYRCIFLSTQQAQAIPPPATTRLSAPSKFRGSDRIWAVDITTTSTFIWPGHYTPLCEGPKRRGCFATSGDVFNNSSSQRVGGAIFNISDKYAF